MEGQKQKSFWKKYELVIIAILTLAAIYVVVVFNQKINFLLGNELIVSLTPSQKYLSMHYGETSNVRFDISIENAAYCSASCLHSFYDKSSNELLDNGTFEIEKGQTVGKSYNLSVSKLGSGQDIYSFEVKCHSIRSFFCLTNSPETSRSSLVIVNYDLTETEKELKKSLKQNVTKLLELLKEADILHQQVSQKYFELGFRINLNNLSKQKIEIDDSYDRTRVSIENLRSLWSVEDYRKLNQLFNGSSFETVHEIENLIGKLDSSINDVTSLHNELLSGLGRMSLKLRELENFANVLNQDGLLNITWNTIKNFNAVAGSAANNTFKDYGSLSLEFENAAEQQTSAINNSRIPATELFFEIEYFLNFEKDLLCRMKQDCNKSISIAEPVNAAQEFLEDYPSIAILEKSCNSLAQLSLEFANIRNQASNSSAGNITFPTDSQFAQTADGYNENLARELNNSYYDLFNGIRLENKINANVMGIADSILPKNKVNIAVLNSTQSGNFSLYLMSRLDFSNEGRSLLSRCSRLGNYSEKIGSFDFSPIRADSAYNITSKIEINLSDNPPICCIFNECRPCCSDECKNDPKTFPVIFLHGHSFAKDNSPEFSLDAFNRLQSKLEDEGYLNAGIVSLYSQNEEMQPGIWGLSGKPVTAKASYYYDAFRQGEKYIVVPTKSENIDTYSLRLKDLIEIVKRRTNKPKVNIVAHSMGGLVARRYMQIFGESSIDKLVMIATPNQGISNDVIAYCGYLGENKECQDMQENSIFLSKLNDKSKQPQSTRLYSIAGQGCQMKTGTGDGIVSLDNAKLENAKTYFVDGACSGIFGENLHTEILNIDRYNETYKIVAEILKE